MSDISQQSTVINTGSAADTRRLGEVMAGFLHRGDLLILQGELGAGKTTLTQGIGAGMRVSQRVTSPTFIIARTHKAVEDNNPNLVHVDAYRLSGGDDIDALDLESALLNSVVVVEWGRGKVEDISEHVLLVTMDRSDDDPARITGTVVDLPEDTACQITLQAVSGSWDLAAIEHCWQQSSVQLPRDQ